MSQELTGLFNAEPKGELPLDLLITQLMHDPRINLHLFLPPSAPARAASSSHVDEGAPEAISAKTQEAEKESARVCQSSCKLF